MGQYVAPLSAWQAPVGKYKDFQVELKKELKIKRPDGYHVERGTVGALFRLERRNGQRSSRMNAVKGDTHLQPCWRVPLMNR